MSSANEESTAASTRRPWFVPPTKLIVLLLVVVGLIGGAWYAFRDRLSLEGLAEHEREFLAYQRSNPVLVYAAAFTVYVLVTALSLPFGAGMTLLAGWLFGFWPALILVSFAATAGATLAFLLSRYLFRDAVRSRFGERLQRFEEALEREGPFYLFTLRLIVAVPFFVINVVMGLTPLRVWTFWWVSQVGMLPGTMVYVYAGASVLPLQELSRRGAGGILTPNVLVAFALLGLFPLVVKKIVDWTRRRGGRSKE